MPMLTQQPAGWTYGDLQRFNNALDASLAYTQFDYVRKIVAPNDAFFKARQDELGNLVLTLGQQFKQQFGQD